MHSRLKGGEEPYTIQIYDTDITIQISGGYRLEHAPVHKSPVLSEIIALKLGNSVIFLSLKGFLNFIVNCSIHEQSLKVEDI